LVCQGLDIALQLLSQKQFVPSKCKIQDEPDQKEESQGDPCQWEMRRLEVWGDQVPYTSEMQGIQGNPLGNYPCPRG